MSADRPSKARRAALPAATIESIVAATHREPRAVLGYHEYERPDEPPLCVVRVLEPDAVAVAVYWEDEPAERARPLALLHGGGLFEGPVPYRRPLVPYRLRIRYRDGHELVKGDPYYFAPQLSDYDLHLFGEGTHHRIWAKLGAHPAVLEGLAGTRFAVWAPNAARVSVVGPFNLWDGRKHAMQLRGASGVWELFIPGLGAGAAYKYEIRTGAGHTRLKSDPYGFAMQLQARQLLAGRRARRLRVERRGLARGACRRRPAAPAGQRLRGAPGLVAPRRRPRAAVHELARGRRAADPVRARPRLHAPRADGRRRAPARRLVGLPGRRLLRADGALRHAARLHASSSTAATPPGSAC